MTSFVYWVSVWVSRFILMPIYASVRTTGLENVPMTGPLVIASNHLNDVDPGVLATRVNRRIVFMAKVELFQVPVLKSYLDAFGAFPVRRGEADLTALRHSSEALHQGLALGIYPEGTREGPTEKLREAWPGAALVALREDALILPVALTGSGRMSFPLMFLRFYHREHITFTIGEPFRLPKPARLNGAAVQEGTRIIMERIAALLPEDHRGYYGSSHDGVSLQATPAETGE